MRFLPIFTLALVCGIINAQPEDKKELFSEGVFFFNREEYSEAAYYFKKLVDIDTANCHYNFRLGECYLNMPGSENNAVKYFERAVTKTVAKKKYRYGDVNETKAPLHAWFYLGNVYRIDGKLSEAMKAYETFINSPLYYGNYNETVVENEIKSLERARIIMESPVDVAIQPLDTGINTTASELCPIVTNDQSSIVFIRRLKFYDAILQVSKQGETWSTPVNLNPQIGSDGEFYPVSFSADGNTMFLMRDYNGNKDLYVSYKQNNVWTKAESLGSGVNSLADETWASLSADGKVLWFTSTRKGGQGGLDIYYAVRGKNNEWKKIKNAGRVINTRFDEESPCISNNDRILYFSSKGHSGMGGYDIFYSIRDGKTWKTPVNLGYPINTTSDNRGYIPVADGSTGYYSCYDVEGNQAEDIYRISLKNAPEP